MQTKLDFGNFHIYSIRVYVRHKLLGKGIAGFISLFALNIWIKFFHFIQRVEPAIIPAQTPLPDLLPSLRWKPVLYPTTIHRSLEFPPISPSILTVRCFSCLLATPGNLWAITTIWWQLPAKLWTSSRSASERDTRTEILLKPFVSVTDHTDGHLLLHIRVQHIKYTKKYPIFTHTFFQTLLRAEVSIG